jgi:hypothetical protein
MQAVAKGAAYQSSRAQGLREMLAWFGKGPAQSAATPSDELRACRFCRSNIAGVHIMKRFYVSATVAITAIFAAGCSSTWPPSAERATRQVPPTAATSTTPTARTDQHASKSKPKPPVLSVRVTDPGTQLILPWFLADIINAVNTHQSFGSTLNTMKQGL